MRERNLKQTDILKKCEPFSKKYGIKVTKSILSQYVSGKAEPGQHKLTVLGLALNVSEAWLMGYDVPMERVAPPPKADALTEEEAALVVAFRKLSDDKRKLVGDMAKMLSEEKN